MADAERQVLTGPTSGPLTFEELQLAGRNRGMPLEGLRYDITPTGMHYLLVHFDIPLIELDGWRLQVGGMVERPLALSLDELRELPRTTLPVTLECAGNGRARLRPRPVSQPWLVEAIGTAEWTGTPVSGVLDLARPVAGASEAVFTGADRGIQADDEHAYARSLALDQAMRPEVMLVYEMNGEPLQPQHGFPLRLLVPGWYGMASVKWLTSIELIAGRFEGYQQAVAYHYRSAADDPGEPVSRIRVRALMQPPGVPDFLTRRRFVERGPQALTGRAWSGHGTVSRVEVGVDGAWAAAQLGPQVGPFAWRAWRHEWQAQPGDHVLSCRATDSAGNVQPTEQRWNHDGLGNNLVQEIAVTVR